MKPSIVAALAIAAGAALLAEPGQSLFTEAQAAAPQPANRLLIQGLASPVPVGWISTPPSSTMRFAQFAVPGAIGSEAAEVAAYYFPTGQGGSHVANIERWASQFTAADGKPVRPVVSTSKSGPTEVTLVELRGSYARNVGMGQAGGAAKADQTLITAMVETPVGRITLQVYGPSKLVAAQRAGFVKFARGFKPA